MRLVCASLSIEDTDDKEGGVQQLLGDKFYMGKFREERTCVDIQ